MVSFERNRGAGILETTVHDLEELFPLRLISRFRGRNRIFDAISKCDADGRQMPCDITC
ncbi:hypothetical protein IAE29_23035 [Ochrobactrum sp. S46]|nr:hypothetical protein [Ochrobactrum sp. S45]MBK0046207.1 hypothetical protein [Ochrobactrum sp. S46]